MNCGINHGGERMRKIKCFNSEEEEFILDNEQEILIYNLCRELESLTERRANDSDY